jgi:lipid II:glycine glycyltransferase (peptidoglycan interpeptide bridge formation enzyme)
MSFWQEKNRWEMLIKSKQVEKILFIDNFQVEKRSIGFWQYGLFLLWLEMEKLSIIDKKFIDLCRQEKCLFIQIETINRIQEKWKEKWQIFKYFKNWYYKKFITPYTAIIDLSKTTEQILADMKPKWRYNIKLAEKKEIKVVEVDKSDDNIKIFYDLMLETTSRDGFSWNKIVYYTTFLKTIKNSNLLIAYKDDKPIAAWIFVFNKEISIYYYWASTNDINYRNLMAPYLLQWTAIKKAKEVWSKYYDFLWITTPWEKNSSLAWVTDFKLKLTKDIVNISDSYIWINNIILYKIISFLKIIKSFLK